MENTVNARVLVLKTELGLSDVEFCRQARLSTHTLHRIKHGDEVTPKSLFSIASGLGVVMHWLKTGEGEKFPTIGTAEHAHAHADRIKELEADKTRLEKEVERLWAIIAQKVLTLPADQAVNFNQLVQYSDLCRVITMHTNAPRIERATGTSN